MSQGAAWTAEELKKVAPNWAGHGAWVCLFGGDFNELLIRNHCLGAMTLASACVWGQCFCGVVFPGWGAVGDDLVQYMKHPCQQPRGPGGMYSLFTRSIQSQDTWPRTLEAVQLYFPLSRARALSRQR